MTVEILEVLGRSEQGITKPFICRADDDEIYFVKGTGAGRRSQLCEWIGGKLGQWLGLPLAPFEIVEVPVELLELGVGQDLSDLGAGLAFGSLRQEVMDAVKQGMFNIYAVSTIDEGIEVLTGVTAGKRRKDGSWTPGSINDSVQRRLQKLGAVVAADPKISTALDQVL